MCGEFALLSVAQSRSWLALIRSSSQRRKIQIWLYFQIPQRIDGFFIYLLFFLFFVAIPSNSLMESNCVLRRSISSLVNNIEAEGSCTYLISFFVFFPKCLKQSFPSGRASIKQLAHRIHTKQLALWQRRSTRSLEQHVCLIARGKLVIATVPRCRTTHRWH